MRSSATEAGVLKALDVRVNARDLVVALVDGRTLSVPLRWYPRLAHATAAERRSWRLVERGRGIHWPELDEDIDVVDLLAGHRSGESKASLERWLQARPRARTRRVRSAAHQRRRVAAEAPNRG